MPAPTTYTEAELKAFMVTEISTTGVALGLTVDSAEIEQAVWAVERLLGVGDVSDATDMATLEAAARWEAWKAAESAAISAVDLKSDGDEIKLSQRLAGLRVRLARAEAAWLGVLAAAEPDEALFDIAEMVTGPFGYRERLYNEALRDG